MKSFKELIVWQRAMELVKSVYTVTAELPSTERFGLTSQMQRSAVSIPSNIAEGHRRRHIKEYLQSLYVAQGSAAELETQLILVKDLYHLKVENSLVLLEETQKMLVLSKRLSKT